MTLVAKCSLAVLLIVLACKASDAWGGLGGEVRRVLVIPFQADSAARTEAGIAVAESLASRLSIEGLVVKVGADSGADAADFVVRGDIAARDGRLVIATRLLQNGQSRDLWSATFWRKDTLDSSLASDLAGSLAEAIYGALAREAVTKNRKTP